MLWLCDEAISGEFSDDRVTEGGGGSKVAVERDGGELVETLSSVLRQNVALRAELGSAALSIPSLLQGSLATNEYHAGTPPGTPR